MRWTWRRRDLSESDVRLLADCATDSHVLHILHEGQVPEGVKLNLHSEFAREQTVKKWRELTGKKELKA